MVALEDTILLQRIVLRILRYTTVLFDFYFNALLMIFLFTSVTGRFVSKSKDEMAFTRLESGRARRGGEWEMRWGVVWGVIEKKRMWADGRETGIRLGKERGFVMARYSDAMRTRWNGSV